jgi:hypothetical protein
MRASHTKIAEMLMSYSVAETKRQATIEAVLYVVISKPETSNPPQVVINES